MWVSELISCWEVSAWGMSEWMSESVNPCHILAHIGMWVLTWSPLRRAQKHGPHAYGDRAKQQITWWRHQGMRDYERHKNMSWYAVMKHSIAKHCAAKHFVNPCTARTGSFLSNTTYQFLFPQPLHLSPQQIYVLFVPPPPLKRLPYMLRFASSVLRSAMYLDAQMLNMRLKIT